MKGRAILASALCLALSLTGCGAGGADSAQTAQQEPAQQEPAQQEPTGPFTVDTPVEAVLQDDAFGDYGRLLFPVDTGYWSGDTLGELQLTWYNNIDPEETVEIVNTLWQRAEAGEILFGTVDTWLVWKLTGGKVHVTDRTNASRTMLYNIRTLDWDDTLLKALDIPRCILPRVADSSEVYGTTDLCGVQIPVAGIAGDQQAALFGQSCFGKGEAKNTYGTGCFLLMNTGDTICRSQNGLISTIGISLNGKVEYALEGSVFVGGAVIQWVRDGLRMIQESRDAEYYAQKVPDNGGIYIVPAFTGLGAPYWDMYARGAIVGITRGTTQNHIIRAAEESIAYQSADLVAAMEKDTGVPITSLKVDGGASRDQFLMQFQADILNKDVLRPAIRETTALGAAYLAGLATGVWKDRDEIRSLWHCNMTFTPAMPEAERARLLSGWHKAVGRSSDWAEH